MKIKHFKFEIEGIVQGVGFRPFIYTLALQNNIKGYVLNHSLGVFISAQGNDEDLEKFEQDIFNKLPPLARIDKLEKKESSIENFKDFIIKESKNLSSKSSLISPDFAMCDDCLRELRDKNDRRYNYFFINCTNCGPRYSIIKTVPYDRKNTSMKPFEMCEECRSEYENPLDRRYHAQPVSCDKCGPTLSLKDMKGNTLAHNIEAIDKFAELITKGAIVALKGMGGFHLICDASNEEVVKELRVRKKRPSKPFAVMSKSIEEIEKYTSISEFEREKILSINRPIVIVKEKKKINAYIAPNIDRLGVFLAYTPLHVMLLDRLNFPIIATSANRSGEPIVTNEDDLKEALGEVIEYYLDYNREIVNSSDDSVLQMIDDKSVMIRSSRGFTPTSIRVNSNENRKILALGAHQKNAISIYLNNQLILAPYIGDLDNIKSVELFEKNIKSFKNFYDFEPDLIVCDKHPLYESTKWAKKQNLPIIQVQHHYAHILSCMFEHNINEKVLGVAWDGTGYGDDGSIWGGEFFVCDNQNYERVAYFEPFKLLGGEASIKDIKRIALSMILDCKEDKIFDDFLSTFSNFELNMLKQIHKKELNSPKCSAVGRLFDMVAVICGVCDKVTYDGESGLILESLYDKKIKDSYDFYFENDIIKYKHTIIDMIKDNDAKIIASKFINSLLKIIIEISLKYKLKVILSGGVFQNRTILENLLKYKSIDFVFSNKFPINDGGISVGQIAYVLNNNH
ncbi:carbamoyltransferase HypF [Sulfurospirillum sp. 1307]